MRSIVDYCLQKIVQYIQTLTKGCLAIPEELSSLQRS